MSPGVAVMAKRNDTTVKIDASVITEAKMVAAARGVTLAEYLTELIRPLVIRDMDEVIAKRSKPAKRPKG